jgi:hypothetical protein
MWVVILGVFVLIEVLLLIASGSWLAHARGQVAPLHKGMQTLVCAEFFPKLVLEPNSSPLHQLFPTPWWESFFLVLALLALTTSLIYVWLARRQARQVSLRS